MFVNIFEKVIDGFNDDDKDIEFLVRNKKFFTDYTQYINLEHFTFDHLIWVFFYFYFFNKDLTFIKIEFFLKKRVSSYF